MANRERGPLRRAIITVADLPRQTSAEALAGSRPAPGAGAGPTGEGGEFLVPYDAVLTPLAREEAARRGLTVKEVEAQAAVRRAPPEKLVALGADHAGFPLKEHLKKLLEELGLEAQDFGVHDEQPADYPDIALLVAEAVAAGRAARGILVDGAGIGSAMAANKVPGVRAALCYDKASARNSREHNNANVLTLGGRLLPTELALEVAATWLTTPFAGGRHQKRVAKIAEIERRYSR